VSAVGNGFLGILLYLMFVGILGFILIQLIFRRGTQGWYRMTSLLWLMWLLLLLPGWLNQFIASIHALFVYLIIGLFFTKFKIFKP
jgi:hypothetical protein